MRSAAALALALLTSCATQRHLVVEDVRAVAKPNVKRLAVAAAAVAVAHQLDRTVAERHPTGQALDDYTEIVEPFGGRYADRVIAGYAIAGFLRHDEKQKNIAFDALVSSLIASRAITPALKAAVHRERPSGSDDKSFPSNHATQAFAVASVIAAHDDRKWVDALAYGIATSVSYARIHHDAHWLSDVVAGAIIGTTVGHTVVAVNRRERGKVRVAVVGRGVVVGVRW